MFIFITYTVISRELSQSKCGKMYFRMSDFRRCHWKWLTCGTVTSTNRPSSDKVFSPIASVVKIGLSSSGMTSREPLKYPKWLQIKRN